MGLNREITNLDGFVCNGMFLTFVTNERNNNSSSSIYKYNLVHIIHFPAFFMVGFPIHHDKAIDTVGAAQSSRNPNHNYK